jgi:hypothetical protein
MSFQVKKDSSLRAEGQSNSAALGRVFSNEVRDLQKPNRIPAKTVEMRTNHRRQP